MTRLCLYIQSETRCTWFSPRKFMNQLALIERLQLPGKRAAVTRYPYYRMAAARMIVAPAQYDSYSRQLKPPNLSKA
ncbi:hypothetical protein NDU88_005772 [Pleurodeles waltl]|uniref:Uncharacterized protein n=1 Tax=Pleurodeles waltl TaxID=8319 RepID=A0AAV7QK07_PLEWA|nr:hypothetical protein NDU88_005772 [Pleurodeles waltl]